MALSLDRMEIERLLGLEAGTLITKENTPILSFQKSIKRFKK